MLKVLFSPLADFYTFLYLRRFAKNVGFLHMRQNRSTLFYTFLYFSIRIQRRRYRSILFNTAEIDLYFSILFCTRTLRKSIHFYTRTLLAISTHIYTYLRPYMWAPVSHDHGPMGSPWNPISPPPAGLHGVPMGSPWAPHGLSIDIGGSPWAPHESPYGLPRPYWLSMGPHGFPIPMDPHWPP